MNLLKQSLMMSLFLSTGSLTFSSQAGTEHDLCAYDKAEMLAMEPWDFDQEDDGWRRLDVHEECYEAAADLIRTYYQNYAEENPLERSMIWHEGQLRADIGQTEEAIELFKQSERSDEDTYGWNYYVRASIAFLQDDYETLMINREKLASLPKPDDLPAMRDDEGNEIEFPWPLNLHVVDSMVACFGRDYAQAYKGCVDD